MFCFPALNIPHVKVDDTKFNTEYANVFVHGLAGWGSYTWYNDFLPYWGMFGGDLMQYLNARGFECYSASVDPTGSAWDRACELYAQLTGTVTDYGEEHSKRCRHDRYGEDYSSDPLIDEWSAEDKINLLGHSFGGVTVRLLAELMANGSEAEREASGSDVSDLFTGGKADWIYSVTALAAPHNGTTAYLVGALVNNEAYGWAFFEDLAAMGTELDSGTSGTHNNVASGGYKVCIAVDYVTQTLESQGSPIKFVYPAEDTIAISSPIALVKGCANPDNGKLLYDFILSEEGQTEMMKADCTPIRDGVAKEGALSASEIAAIALKPDEAKLAQEKQDTLDHFDQLFK